MNTAVFSVNTAVVPVADLELDGDGRVGPGDLVADAPQGKALSKRT